MLTGTAEFVLVTLAHVRCTDMYNFNPINRSDTNFLFKNNLGARYPCLHNHLKTLCKYRLVTFLQFTHFFWTSVVFPKIHANRVGIFGSVKLVLQISRVGWRAIPLHSMLIEYCSFTSTKQSCKNTSQDGGVASFRGNYFMHRCQRSFSKLTSK